MDGKWRSNTAPVIIGCWGTGSDWQVMTAIMPCSAASFGMNFGRKGLPGGATCSSNEMDFVWVWLLFSSFENLA